MVFLFRCLLLVSANRSTFILGSEVAFSGHATTITICRRGICIPRAQSSGGADACFSERTRFRGVRGGNRASQNASANAGPGVVRNVQSLAFRALAARRRRPVGIHALVDGHAHAALARSTSHVGNRPVVPGPFQVVPDPKGRPSLDRAAVRGAKPVAGQHGRGGRCVTLVQPLASSTRQQGGASRRWPGGSSTALETTSAIAPDRGRTGSLATVGNARCPLRRRIMAAANCKAIGPGIHLASPWSATQNPSPANL